VSGKSFVLAALLALAPVPYGSIFGQSQPAPSPSQSAAPPPAQSLGDIARQVRSEKNSAPPKKVFTNDNLSSDPGIMDLRLTESAEAKSSPGIAPASSSAAVPSSAPSSSLTQLKSSLDKMDAMLNQLDSMDRAALVKSVLQNNDVNFPGRADWEQRLLAARQANVTQGRELTQYARQLMAVAQMMDAAHVPPSDPRMIDLEAKLKQFAQDYGRSGAAFQAAVAEGRDLAKQTSSH
jgi:hypothetical protein